MSVVQPGSGKGSGSSGARKSAQPPTPGVGGRPPGARSGAKAPPRQAAKPPTRSAAKAPPRPGTKTPPRPGGKPPPKGRSAGANGKAGARPGKTITAAPPRRFSPSTLAFASVAVVVVVVVALVLVKILGGSSTPTGTLVGPVDTPAKASVLAEVTGVTPSEAATVGLPSSVIAPTVFNGQPPLTSGGHPAVLYIGAEYCPYCAAERWAIVMALSRFGTFSNLQETTSSPWDTDPQTPTFSFHGAGYTSPSLVFEHVENVSNDAHGPGTRTTLEPLNSTQSALWATYSSKLGQSEGFPFVDFGNKVVVLGPSYDPTVLQGLVQTEVASRLSNPHDPVTQSIVGTANYLTAAVCSLTHQQPTMWCSAPGTKKAAAALKLS